MSDTEPTKYGYRVDFDILTYTVRITRVEVVRVSEKTLVYRDGTYENEWRSPISGVGHEWCFSLPEAQRFALAKAHTYQDDLQKKQLELDESKRQLKKGMVYLVDAKKWDPKTKVVV